MIYKQKGGSCLPRLTGVLSIRTFAEKLSKTVGMYSPGKAFVVYEIRRHVFPTAPSPTTTHFMGLKRGLKIVRTFQLAKLEAQMRRKEAYLHFETLILKLNISKTNLSRSQFRQYSQLHTVVLTI